MKSWFQNPPSTRQERVLHLARALVEERDVGDAALARHRRREPHVDAQQVLGHGVAGRRDADDASLGRRRRHAGGQSDGGGERARPVAADAREIDADVVAPAGLERKRRREAHAAVGDAVAAGDGGGGGASGFAAWTLTCSSVSQAAASGESRGKRGALVAAQAGELDDRRGSRRGGVASDTASGSGRRRDRRSAAKETERGGRRRAAALVTEQRHATRPCASARRAVMAARSDSGSGIVRSERPVSALASTTTRSPSVRSSCSTPLRSATRLERDARGAGHRGAMAAARRRRSRVGIFITPRLVFDISR